MMLKTISQLKQSRALSNKISKMSYTTRDHFYQIMQLDDTRRELLQSVEKFADEEVKPLADQMDKTMVFPRHMWKRLGEMGLLGMTADEEYGGTGLGYYEHCLAVE